MVYQWVRTLTGAVCLAAVLFSNVVLGNPLQSTDLADKVVADLHYSFEQGRIIWDRPIDNAIKKVVLAYLDLAASKPSDGEDLIEVRSDYFAHVFADWIRTVTLHSWGMKNNRIQAQRNLTLVMLRWVTEARPISDPAVREIFARRLAKDLDSMQDRELSELSVLARDYRENLKYVRIGEYLSSAVAGLVLLKTIGYLTGSFGDAEIAGVAGFFASAFALRELIPALPKVKKTLRDRRVIADMFALKSEICERLLKN